MRLATLTAFRAAVALFASGRTATVAFGTATAAVAIVLYRVIFSSECHNKFLVMNGNDQ